MINTLIISIERSHMSMLRTKILELHFAKMIFRRNKNSSVGAEEIWKIELFAR